MKRRIIVTVLAFALAMSVAVYASAEQITAGSSGFTNVSFSNGYYGFCIDRYLSGAYSGDSFNVADDTSAAKSNADGSDISQKLKILFTQCFDTLFLSNGNGGYVIDSNKADGDLAYSR